MNTQHTPAPWKVISDPSHYDTLSTVIAGDSRDTGTRRGAPAWQMQVEVGGFAEFREQEANARLIAAAPDMLEALKTAVAYPLTDDWYQQANDAIAKATRKEQA